MDLFVLQNPITYETLISFILLEACQDEYELG